MDENLYKPPESELVAESQTDTILATRGSRLLASIIDGLVISSVTIPLMYFTGGFDGIARGVQPSFTYSITIALIGIAAFFAINGHFLKTTGQTIGKKIVKIKVVTLDNDLPTLGNHFLKRYLVYFVPGQVPLIGQLFSLVNILFIFGKSKRCVHDYAAGTKVVAA